jgi:hypothetical protein
VGVTLTIRDERAPGRPTASFALEDVPSRLTVRDLIRTRVRDEVARYNAAPTREFRLLVQPVGAEMSPNGFRFKKPRKLDWEQQADAAIEAFGRNGFILLVGDRQVVELDEELELDADTEIRFLRLTPLVGG